MNENRDRANSWGTITEYINKRKRQEKEDTAADKEEEEEDVFKRSKVTVRSPQKTSTNIEIQGTVSDLEMEKIEDLIKGLSVQIQEIKVDTGNTATAIGIINEQMKEYGEEIRVLKEEALKKELEWKEEKNELKKEIEIMKIKLENQEKKERKNNIIIKGKNFPKENKKQEIKEFVKKELGVKVEIEEAYKVGREEMNVTVVKLENFEQKIEILKNKYKLGRREIYIDCDLTKEEQKIQATIRKVAKEERNAGKKTKVGYRKMVVDGIQYEWRDEEGGRLVEITDSRTKN